MEFLYPKFDKPTHKIKVNANTSMEYPKTFGYNTSKDYNLGDVDISAALIRENIGYKCGWSQVKIIDTSSKLNNTILYVKSTSLENIGTKESYESACSQFNQIDDKAEIINPIFKEIFIPYVDRYNGLFSVRVQIDHDRIVDMKLFDKMLEEVYLEGVNVLLASRGLKSDNDTIRALRDKYYCFAYINNDLDLTVRRPCEPLTFTVSIPLNFFNKQEKQAVPEFNKLATQFITFTNKDFISTIDLLISMFFNKTKAVEDLKFPNKQLENFLISFEINSLRSFAVVTNELLSIADYPIDVADINTIRYRVGLDNNLNLISVDIEKYSPNNTLLETASFTQGLLAQSRLRGEFSNKRIFNYLLNLQGMISEYSSLEILEYLQKYIKYPNIRLIEETVQIDNITFSEEQVKEFRLNFQKDTESCVSLQDITDLVGEAARVGQNVSTAAYFLFSAKDPNNGFTLANFQDNVKNAFNYVKGQANQFNLTSSAVNVVSSNSGFELLESAGDFAVDTISAVAGYAEQDFKANLATLGYIARRLNLQEIILKKILCYLKGADPNDVEVAQTLSQLPYEVINYLKYMQTIQSLYGFEYIRALEEGLTIDFELFCNDEVAYFIKGLTKLLSVTALGITQTLRFIREIDSSLKSLTLGRRVTHPYQAIVRSVSKTVYTAILDFLFGYIRDLLTEECDEALLDANYDDFFDPFATHIPVSRFNLPQNNDKEQLRKNRLSALNGTLPDIVRELTFGSDVEYTIDLIDLLLRDVNCVLTATESINLLSGSPSDEVIVLIKNIIRNKYNKDPNNLTYLLNDDKLKLFFEKLGLTVDKEYIVKYSDPVIELIKKTGTDVCTPEQLEVRKSILENKIPKELGTLKADTRNRVSKARKLLERLQNGETVYNISALCPEIDDDEILQLKDDLFEEYSSTIKSIFSNTLNNFNQEVNKVINKFSEEKAYYRVTSDGKPFETIPYYTYNSNLGQNIYLREEGDYLNTGIDEAYGGGNYIRQETGITNIVNATSSISVYKIKNRDSISDSQLSDILLKSEPPQKATLDECSNPYAVSDLDPAFERIILDKKVIYETVYRGRDWNSIDKSHRQRYYDKINGVEKSGFLKELEEFEEKTFLEELKNNKITVFILSNPDDDLEDKELIFRLIYWDPSIGVSGDFRLLKERILKQKDIPDTEKVINSLGFYTGEFWIRNRVFGFDELEIIAENHKKYYPLVDAIYSKKLTDAIELKLGANIFWLGKDFLDARTADTAKNIPFSGSELANEIRIGLTKLAFNYIQSSIVEMLNESIQAIDVYEKLLYSKQELEKNGIFNITTNYQNKTQKVFVAATSVNSTIEYREFYGTHPDVNYITINTSSYDDLQQVNFDYGYRYDVALRPLYGAIFDKLSSSYIKLEYDFDEFSLQNKEDDTGTLYNVDYIDTKYINEPAIKLDNYTMIKNPGYKDKFIEKYLLTGLMDYGNNPEYANCQLYPHYLNLDYFLEQAKGDLTPKICDTNLGQIPNDLLDYILTRLTVRAHVTDYLTKTVGYLTLLDRQDLLNLHNEQYIVDILRNHMQAEMHIFTNLPGIDLGGQNDYFTKFVNTIVEKTFNNALENNKINKKYDLNTSKSINRKIDYYIRKEIYHFLVFSLENEILKPSEKSLYKEETSYFLQYIYGYKPFFNPNGGVTGAIQVRNAVEAFLLEIYKKSNFIRSEFFNAFTYFLMSSTVDSNKRNLLAGTKSELARLFLGRMNSLPDSDTNYPENPQEDIVKFISKLAYTSNPAALMALNPDYSKYINFFVEATFEETRSILLNSSMFTDLNVSLTRIINFALSTATGITWSLVDKQTRQNLINDAALNNKALGLLYKRFDSAMSPIPDIVVGIGLSAYFRPTRIGSWYYIFDTIKEGIWAYRTWKELNDIAKSLRGQQQIDPCQQLPGDGDNTLPPCTPERRKELSGQINSREEGT